MSKHPLRFVQSQGVLSEALGLTPEECKLIEDTVKRCIGEGKNKRELFEIVGELDISDEVWATFLYTYGWWDRQRT